MKWNKLFLVLIVLFVTQIAFAGDVKLNIIPPEDDGGSPLTYYRIEYKARLSSVWIKHRDVPAEKSILGNYKSVSETVYNLKENMQYEFRVRAINANGVGEPGDIALSITVPKVGYVGPVDIHSGQGVQGKGKSLYCISDLLCNNDDRNIQIPYRLEE